ncbi:MAG: hypothetical protein R2780_12610 [Crocinitomicaceae bacterium]|nr:hypothetical protein [Crocinitomicaceae bacterium]
MSKERPIVAEYPVTVGNIIRLANGITEMRFNSEYLIDITELKEVQSVIDKIAETEDVYILVIPGPDGNMSKEAREAPMFSNNRTKAIAIIANMLHQRILGNLYFKFRKAQFTNYKLFKSEQNARNWLLLQMAENNKD